MIAEIINIIFTSKQNIPWSDVEKYLKRYIGQDVVVTATKDVIHIGSDFPDEYAESRYTKRLRGALAKAKANATTVIVEMIQNANNRRWVENKAEKHENNATGGWYRYDTSFGMPVQGSQEDDLRLNVYRATLIVRIKQKKLYLYDVVDIKKEASTPHES